MQKSAEGVVGGDNLPAAFAAAGYEARIATTNARTTQDLAPLHAKALSLHVVFMLLPMLRGPGRDRHGRILRSVAGLVETNKLHPLLDDSRFTLATAPEAYRRLASGKAQGKVVIDIVGEDERLESRAAPACTAHDPAEWPKATGKTSRLPAHRH